MECVRITPNGIITIDFTKDIPRTLDALTKWLVGITCGITVIACVAAEIFVPALLPVTSAVSGAAIEVFIQVVIDNQTVDNINWQKVAVTAAASTLMAWACPALAAGASKGVVKILGEKAGTKLVANLTGKIVQYASTALVTGSTNAAYAMIDGKESEEVFDAFKFGVIIGASFSVGADALGQVLKRIGPKVAQVIEKVTPNKWLNRIKTLNGKTTAFIAEHQIHLKNTALEEILAPKSVFQATKSAMDEIYHEKNVLSSSINALPADDNKNFIKIDSSGKTITKKELVKNGGDCIIKLTDNCDPQIKKFFEEKGVSELIVDKGNIDLSVISEYSFTPMNGISSNRSNNLSNYYSQIANDWKNNPEVIPLKVREVLDNEQIGQLNASKVQEVLSNVKLTPHEGKDGRVYLIDSFIHNKISHYGGVAWAKAMDILEAMNSKSDELAHYPIKMITGESYI